MNLAIYISTTENPPRYVCGGNTASPDLTYEKREAIEFMDLLYASRLARLSPPELGLVGIVTEAP